MNFLMRKADSKVVSEGTEKSDVVILQPLSILKNDWPKGKTPSVVPFSQVKEYGREDTFKDNNRLLGDR